jgi:aspartyl-tRNA(Asn)/glutamyl-tRNA(Gln) amidotransferase subunit C
MSLLSTSDIEHIALLARLDLSENEKERYAEQLSAVFGFFESLREVDISGVKETCQVTGLEDVMREDSAAPCDEETRKKLIDAFPDRIGKLLKVPGVFE